MYRASSLPELEEIVSKVTAGSFTGEIECSGEIAKDVRGFFSTYERSGEQGWLKTWGGLGTLAIAAAAVATGGLAAVAVAAVGATVIAVSQDSDQKATKRLALGDLCYPIANMGYRMRQNRHDKVLLSR